MSDSPSTAARTRKAPKDHAAPDPDEVESAAQAEAVGQEMISVEFDGRTFTYPRDPLDWLVGARRAFSRGDVQEGLPFLLGDQYADANIDGWTGHKLNDLFAVMMKASGVDSSGN